MVSVPCNDNIINNDPHLKMLLSDLFHYNYGFYPSFLTSKNYNQCLFKYYTHLASRIPSTKYHNDNNAWSSTHQLPVLYKSTAPPPNTRSIDIDHHSLSIDDSNHFPNRVQSLVRASRFHTQELRASELVNFFAIPQVIK